MKIYRVVPDSFATNGRLNARELTGVEDIYYRMGYTSFVGKRGFHEFNTIVNHVKEEGKYFYLFLEDAILEGHHLIGGYHRLRMDTFSVLEYDVPEEIIFKNLGYGDYTSDITKNLILETYIQKSDFASNTVSTTELSKEEKLKGILESFKESLVALNEFRFSSLDDIFYYKGLFCDERLDSVIQSPQRLEDVLLSSSLYLLFLREKGELIKSPYLTGKVIPVNLRYISRNLGGFDKAAEYFQNQGFQCDFSLDHKDFKKELLYQLDCDTIDQEKVKSLLKSKNYI